MLRLRQLRAYLLNFICTARGEHSFKPYHGYGYAGLCEHCSTCGIFRLNHPYWRTTP